MEFCQSKKVGTLVIIQIQNVKIITDNKNNQGGHSTAKIEFGFYFLGGLSLHLNHLIA